MAAPSQTSPPTQIAKRVVDVNVSDEMRDSFMPYAVSVTTARAIPDVRDGLKPVQRRILHVMNRLGLRPGQPFRKSAGVVGEVMGKFHPHGDSAIYEAMVRMGQPFAMSAPMVDPRGNFGSLDDPPAAYRYTEARMAGLASAMVADIDEDTVDFADTFDGERTEPTCLPGLLPNLLVNGATGIAVGMATNMAPHNLTEAVEAVKLVLASHGKGKRSQPTVNDLLAVMPGPDFPCGGVIIDDGSLPEIYATGRGTIRVRARTGIEKATARRSDIVVTELPYMVGPERVVSKIRELIAAEKLDGIASVEDHSDRRHGLQLRIGCKPGADPHSVLRKLWQTTPLEDTFSFNQVALVDGVPRLMGLPDICRHYVTHRIEVVVRRTRWRLARAEERAHIVEGLLVALDSIDRVVKIIRTAKDTATARQNLQTGLNLSATQADHILEMRLRRLTALETDRLRRELDELRSDIDRYQKILASEQRQRTIIARELDQLAAAHSEPRCSRIVPVGELDSRAGDGLAVGGSGPDDQGRNDGGGGAFGGSLFGSSPAWVAVSASGLIGRSSDDGGRKLKPGRHDTLTALAAAETTGKTRLFTDRGTVHSVDTESLPEIAGRSRGVPVRDVVSLARGERIVGAAPDGVPLVVVTSVGTAKRLDPVRLAKFADRNDGGDIIPLQGAARLVAVFPVNDSDEAAVMTSQGMVLRFKADTLPLRGPDAGGIAAVKLPANVVVVAAGRAPQQGSLDEAGVHAVAVLDDGDLVKVTDLAEIPTRGRGSGGSPTVKLPTGRWVADGRIGADTALTLTDNTTVPVPPATARNRAPQPVEPAVTAVGSRRH